MINKNPRKDPNSLFLLVSFMREAVETEMAEVGDLNAPAAEECRRVLDCSNEKGIKKDVIVEKGSVTSEASKQLEGSAKSVDMIVENSGGVVLGSSRVAASERTHRLLVGNEKVVGKPSKRKRASISGDMLSRDKDVVIMECHQELHELFQYYKELSGCKLKLEDGVVSSNNSLIACLLEESTLPYSKLVEEIYENLKAREAFTLASVRSAIHAVGQRMTYGVTNADADVLEDESELCLWCWETRDVKLLPSTQRGILKVRRIGRKKIHERISNLSATLSSLESCKSGIIHTSPKPGKILNGEEIRSLVEKLKQKNDADMAEKLTKRKERELIKEMEKNKRCTEKEKRKMDNGFRKEILQSEKELKQLQEEAAKVEMCHEKEEAEVKKLLKKQREAERDQRRREKAEADMKKNLSLQKQATIMERFLKAKKSNISLDNANKRPSTKNQMSGSPCKVEVFNATISYMDNIFSQGVSLDTEDLRKMHVDGWHKLSRCNRSCRWGIRHKPKMELFKELRLQGSTPEAKPHEKVGTPKYGVVSSKIGFGRETSFNKPVDGSEESFINDNLNIVSSSLLLLGRKLLQFDKSNRPAFYGTWSKKSEVVGPRHPFKKDPNLDYDVDSDEEWEEEEPGESLSDSDKDNEEETLEVEKLEVETEEEGEDDFIVPDGYLSENEGVQMDSSSDNIEDDAQFCCKSEAASEEIRAFLCHQTRLGTLTEQTLRKGHPFVISNLSHGESEISSADTNNTRKLEQMCLQALCMRVCAGDSAVDISVSRNSNEELEVPLPQHRSKICSTPTHTAAGKSSDEDLAEFVSSIRSNAQSISKVLESLQPKFPSTPKSQLKSKVREISDYVDNCWQVKKEILDKLGLSASPGKGLKPKGIAAFFSRRSLTPQEEPTSVAETSQQCSKAAVHHSDGSPCS